MNFLQSYGYLITVFITGACVLVVEVVALRLLAPYFGNTIFMASSVLSVILGALSVGYYWGGQLADRYPSVKVFYGLITLSGLVLLVLHLIGLVLLPLLGTWLSIASGPLVAAVVLFLLPAVLLGMLSPFVVKLQSLAVGTDAIGTVAGSVFFWSTFGSITGSLLAGFVLIPHFGVHTIMVSTAACLMFFGLMTLGWLRLIGSKKLLAGLTLLLGAIGFASLLGTVTHPNIVYSYEGLYETVAIYDTLYKGRPTRTMVQNQNVSGGMFLDTSDPTDMSYEYTKYYKLYSLFNPAPATALVIGGGPYTVPKALLHEFPNIEVDVAEIEPKLLSVVQEYFMVEDNDRLHNHVEDGRRFLEKSEVTYDFIFSDAYSAFTMPSHHVTKEFFDLVRSRLSPNGTVILNVVGDLYPADPSLTLSMMRTFKESFPNSYFIAVQSPHIDTVQNIMFVGAKSDDVLDFTTEAMRTDSSSVIRGLFRRQIDLDQFDLEKQIIFTDDYVPVEYLSIEPMQRSQ